MKYQDIHLSDLPLFTQLKQLWAAGNYTEAIQLLSNVQLNGKQWNAETLNELFDEVELIQQFDPSEISVLRIQVGEAQPVAPKANELWFELSDYN